MNKAANKKLAEIYHSLRTITGDIENIQKNTDTADLRKQLEQIGQKLYGTQKQVLETIVEDVAVSYLVKNASVKKDELGLKDAVALIQKIEKKAAEMNMSVIIAVYNKAARPIAVHCMDDAYIASYDVATSKAYTSAALKMPTTALKKLCQPGQELYGIQFTNQGRIIIFGGGVPLNYNGKLIGALGVSGGTEEQDTMLAEYGGKMLEEVIK